MMQTKTNEQKMRVIVSNKKPSASHERSSKLGQFKTTAPFAASSGLGLRQLTTTHASFGGDYQIAPNTTNMKRDSSPLIIQQNSGLNSGLSMTGQN